MIWQEALDLFVGGVALAALVVILHHFVYGFVELVTNLFWGRG